MPKSGGKALRTNGAQEDMAEGAPEKEKLLTWSAIVCLVYCGVVGLFFIIGLLAGGPLERWKKPDPEELWHTKTAMLLVFSAMCTEICFLVSSSATVKVMGWNVSTKLQVHTLGDSILTCSEYAVKVACGMYIYYYSGGIVHVDQLAFGGSRPVYFGRFAQWSIGVPILVLLSNRAFIPHCSTLEMFLRCGPSLLVCFVYIWAAWLMEVTPSGVVRWPMFFLSLCGQVVVSIDQLVLAFAHRHQPLFGLKLAMLTYELVAFTLYAIVFVMGRFGVFASLTEQTIYAYTDATIKVFQGTLLAIVRHRSDLQTIRHWWIAAQMASQDLEMLIQRACLPVFGLDLSGRITFWNSSLESLTGTLSADVKPQLLVDVVAPDCKETLQTTFTDLVMQTKEVSANVTTNITKGYQLNSESETHAMVWPKSSLVEITIPCSDGKGMRQLAMSLVPKSGQDGRLVGFMGIGQDLSEVSELKFIQARKSALMAMLSHEIRSPLHGIMGLSGALIESDAGKSMHKQLGMIRACADRLLDLVTNIMFLAHQEKEKQSNQPQPRPTDPVHFAAIADEVITLTQGAVDKSNRPLLKTTVKLVNELSSQRLPYVPGDKQKCTQMIYNLLTNACKFTDKGSITIGGRYVPEKKVLEVDVTDTGRGISKEGQARIFQPFEQETNGDARSFQGIGLGLSVCTEIASLHGGEIRLASELGKGSTFTIVLPCDASLGLADTVDPTLEEAPVAKQATDGPEPARTKSKEKNKIPTVLSVDDDDVNQEVVKNALSSFCQVEIAMDGQEALAFLEGRKKAGHPFPDIVLLDIQMPGMTGYEVCEQIRKCFEVAHAKLPVIMVSARTPYDKTAIEGYDTGMTDFLAKPFNSEVLRKKVQVAMKVKEDAAMGASMLVMKEASQKVKESQIKYEDMKKKASDLAAQLEKIKEEQEKSAKQAEAERAQAEATESARKAQEMEAQEKSAKQAEAERAQAVAAESARKAQEMEAQAKEAQAKTEQAEKRTEEIRAEAKQAQEKLERAEQRMEELRAEVGRLQQQVDSAPQQPQQHAAHLNGVAEKTALARAELAEQQNRALKQQVEQLLQQQGANAQEAEVQAQSAEQLQKRVEALLQQQDLSVTATTKQADSRVREAEARAQLAEMRAEELQRQFMAQPPAQAQLHAPLLAQQQPERISPSWARETEVRAREAEAKAERLQKQLVEAETKALIAEQKAEQWQSHVQQVLQKVERPSAGLSLPGGGLPPGTLAAAAAAMGDRSCGQLQRHLEAQARSFVSAKAVISVMSSRFQMIGKVAGQCRQLLAPGAHGDAHGLNHGGQSGLEFTRWHHASIASGPVLERAIGAQLALVEQTAAQSDELATLISADGGSPPDGHLAEGGPWGGEQHQHLLGKLPGCMGV